MSSARLIEVCVSSSTDVLTKHQRVCRLVFPTTKLAHKFQYRCRGMIYMDGRFIVLHASHARRGTHGSLRHRHGYRSDFKALRSGRPSAARPGSWIMDGNRVPESNDGGTHQATHCVSSTFIYLASCTSVSLSCIQMHLFCQVRISVLPFVHH